MKEMSKHPKYELPNDPHAKHRYESAMKHVEHAKKLGKSSEEIHEIFHKIMAFNPEDIDSTPKDDAHKTYRSAVIHALKAKENGKSSEEIHKVFQDIMDGKAGKHSHAK